MTGWSICNESYAAMSGGVCAICSERSDSKSLDSVTKLPGYHNAATEYATNGAFRTFPTGFSFLPFGDIFVNAALTPIHLNVHRTLGIRSLPAHLQALCPRILHRLEQHFSR
jgi:hypothetical protein